jgi:hypothetical protein
MTEGNDVPVGTAVVVTGVYAGGVLKVVRPEDVPAPPIPQRWRSRLGRLSLAYLIGQRKEH